LLLHLQYAVIVGPHDFTFAPDHVFVVTASPFSFKEKEVKGMYIEKEEKGMDIKRHEIWTVVFLKTPFKRLERCCCRQ
jgi:hypothetical protein